MSDKVYVLVLNKPNANNDKNLYSISNDRQVFQIQCAKPIPNNDKNLNSVSNDCQVPQIQCGKPVPNKDKNLNSNDRQVLQIQCAKPVPNNDKNLNSISNDPQVFQIQCAKPTATSKTNESNKTEDKINYRNVVIDLRHLSRNLGAVKCNESKLNNTNLKPTVNQAVPLLQMLNFHPISINPGTVQCYESTKSNANSETTLNQNVHLLQMSNFCPISTNSESTVSQNDQVKKKFKCDECEKCFPLKYSLSRHIKTKHPFLIPKVVFRCRKCEEEFRWRSHLRKHRCSKAKVLVKRQICPLCRVQLGKDFIPHFEEVHSIKIEKETLQFPNMEEFKKWKIDEESKTYSSFISQHGSKKNKNAERTISYYLCHRSGFHVTKSQGIRNTKSRVKINGFCPARMKVTLTNTNSCTVHYLKTHIGHSNDLHPIRLSKAERLKLAANIVKKKTFTDILTEIHSAGSDKYKKIKFTKKRLNNAGNELESTCKKSTTLEIEGTLLSSNQEKLCDTSKENDNFISIDTSGNSSNFITIDNFGNSYNLESNDNDEHFILLDEKEVLKDDITKMINSITSIEQLKMIKTSLESVILKTTVSKE